VENPRGPPRKRRSHPGPALLRLPQVKKPTRAQKPAAFGGNKSSKTKKPKRDPKSTSGKTSFARKSPTRIPVRGDAKSEARRPDKRGKKAAPTSPRRSGVRARVVESAPVSSTSRDLEELRALALDAMNAALDKKALMPVLIDVSGMASYTDFIGIVSGRSDRQVDAIADGITALMKGRGRMPLGQEGTGSGRWTLLDFGSIVVHVFYHPVREFYDLESLWIDAPRVKMDVPPEAMLTQPDALYGAL
jgi:ribosome-associated protein